MSLILLFLLVLYLGVFAFIVSCRRVKITVAGGPANFGERLVCGFIWPIIGSMVIIGLITGTCKIRRTK